MGQTGTLGILALNGAYITPRLEEDHSSYLLILSLAVICPGSHPILFFFFSGDSPHIHLLSSLCVYVEGIFFFFLNTGTH